MIVEQPDYSSLLAWTDGGARGNPGPAGIGGVIKDDTGTIVATVSEFLGEATNNVAEYTALLRTVEKCRSLGAQRVHLHLDSELVVKQVKGEYKVKNPNLKPLHMAVKTALVGLDVEITHVPREMNHEADALANEAMDGALSGPVAPEPYPEGQDSLF